MTDGEFLFWMHRELARRGMSEDNDAMVRLKDVAERLREVELAYLEAIAIFEQSNSPQRGLSASRLTRLSGRGSNADG